MGYGDDGQRWNRKQMTRFGATGGLELRHVRTQQLFEYWTSLRAGRSAPYKSEVTAQGLGRSLAGNVFIMEKMGDGALRYRLAGSRLYDYFGLELRGMSGPTIMETSSRMQFRSLVDDCLAGPEIGVVWGAAEAEAGNRVNFELMLAPLRSDFDQLNRLLGCVFALDRHEADLAAAPRRCKIERVTTYSFDAEAPMQRRDGPLPGFAEAATPFQHDGPGLRAIDGGASGDATERRRGHLKLVKD